MIDFSANPLPGATFADVESQRSAIAALFDTPAPLPAIEALSSRQDRLLADLGIGLWQCDLATDALIWGGGVWNLFGFERGEAPLRAATLARYHPQSRAELEMLRRAAIATGTGFAMDAVIVDGRDRRRTMRLTARVGRVGGRALLYGMKHDLSL